MTTAIVNNFVQPEELQHFVESMHAFPVKDIGSPEWFKVHEMIVKLGQQAFLEAYEQREEEVKELLLLHDKLKVLIHEAYSVSLWKTRVLPHLLELNPNPQATFFIYSVLHHEGAVVALLDTALYHSSVCEALKDETVDLIDYCVQGVSQTIGLVGLGYSPNLTKTDLDESVLSELERQKRDIIYKIGLRSISILNYVSENLHLLPMSAGRRFVTTHDVPWLLVELLTSRPWQRRTPQGMQKYINEEWVTVSAADIQKTIKHEAQVWFCLRNLLFNKDIMSSYQINEERRTQILRCQGMLNEVLLDQLPPLIPLKEFLSHLAVSGPTKSKDNPLLLEEMPKIRENILVEADRYGGFVMIAEKQAAIFLTEDKDYIIQMAGRLSSMYNTDLMEEYVGNPPEANPRGDAYDGVKKCKICGEQSSKKCGKCQAADYCSKKCQLADWPDHKLTCQAKA